MCSVNVARSNIASTPPSRIENTASSMPSKGPTPSSSTAEPISVPFTNSVSVADAPVGPPSQRPVTRLELPFRIAPSVSRPARSGVARLEPLRRIIHRAFAGSITKSYALSWSTDRHPTRKSPEGDASAYQASTPTSTDADDRSPYRSENLTSDARFVWMR